MLVELTSGEIIPQFLLIHLTSIYCYYHCYYCCYHQSVRWIQVRLLEVLSVLINVISPEEFDLREAAVVVKQSPGCYC